MPRTFTIEGRPREAIKRAAKRESCSVQIQASAKILEESAPSNIRWGFVSSRRSS